MILPNTLTSNPETGLYQFTSDAGITYACRFRNITKYLSPLLGIYDLEIFEFDFFPETNGDKKIKRDDRVSATVGEMIGDFFTNDLRVLVYTCDDSDEKHAQRNVLFRRWYTLYLSETLQRIPVDIEIDTEGDVYITHGCVLARHDFPHMEILDKELIKNAPDIMYAKFVF